MTNQAIRIEPEEELFRTLAQAYHIARKVAEKIVEPAGLTLAEYHLLRIVENTPGVTAVDAGKRLFSTAASVAQLVRSLERKKCIKRTRNTGDARIQHIALTAAAKRMLVQVRAAMHREIGSTGIGKQLLESTVANIQTLTNLLTSSLT